MSETLSTIDAARRAHVTVKQLRNWAARGFVQPRADTGVGGYAWPLEEVDRAEILGALARQFGKPDLFLSLAEALEAGTYLVLPDGDYEIVISWRARDDG